MAKPKSRDALVGSAFHPEGLFKSAGTRAPIGPFGMLPYRKWSSTDERPVSELTQRERKQRLLEVIQQEGPMPSSWAYRTCSFGKKHPAKTKILLNLALAELFEEGAICVRGVVGQEKALVYAVESPPVVVRELGPRRLFDLAPSEVAEVMVRTQINLGQEERVFETVRRAYGLLSIADRNRAFLLRCIKLARLG